MTKVLAKIVNYLSFTFVVCIAFTRHRTAVCFCC